MKNVIRVFSLADLTLFFSSLSSSLGVITSVINPIIVLQPQKCFHKLSFLFYFPKQMFYTLQLHPSKDKQGGDIVCGFPRLSLAKSSWESLPSVAPMRWACPRRGNQTGG